MDVLLANEITPAMVLSNTAPEQLSGQTEWVSKSYNAGDVVTVSETRRVYRAAYRVPTGTQRPDLDIAGSFLPRWQDIGPMNQWGMFDGVMKSQTVMPSGDLVVVLRPGVVTNLWAANLDNVTAVSVVMKDKTGGTIVYSETRSLAQKVTNFWDWWFAPFSMQRDAPFAGLPAYLQGEITITFTATSDARVGMLAAGKMERLGCTEWNVNAAYNNYSARNLNQVWGPTEATEGEASKDIDYRVLVAPEDAPRVDRFMKNAIRRPAVWIPHGHPKFEGIRIFGQAISASMGYPGPNYVPLDITIREFI